MAEAIVKTEKENTWSMIKLGLILAAYAIVACALLAVVNNFTAPKIADNQAKKVSAAMKEFFPDAGLSFETVNDFTPPVVGAITVDEIYVAKKGNEITLITAENAIKAKDSSIKTNLFQTGEELAAAISESILNLK